MGIALFTLTCASFHSEGATALGVAVCPAERGCKPTNGPRVQAPLSRTDRAPQCHSGHSLFPATGIQRKDVTALGKSLILKI